MKVVNVSGRPREIAATGQTVQPDQAVEVPDRIGRSLCEQPDRWKPQAEVKAPAKSDTKPASGEKE